MIQYRFITVFNIIFDSCKKGMVSSEELFHCLFDWIYHQSTNPNPLYPDSSQINKFIHGKRSLPKKIVSACVRDYFIASLKEEIEHSISPLIMDKKRAKDLITNLLIQDETISYEEKKQLLIFPYQTDTFSEFLSLSLQLSVRFEDERQILMPSFQIPKNTSLSATALRFFGREDLLSQIYNSLHQKLGTPLFLYGIGGIGKTEIAKEYARRHTSEYEATILIKFNHDFTTTLSHLKFDPPLKKAENNAFSDKSDDFYTYDSDLLSDSILAWLYSLPPTALLILDNLDILPENDPIYHLFMNSRCSKIITSRQKSEIYPSISIDELSSEEAVELFRHHWPETTYSVEEIQNTIDAIYYHTMTIELLAKTLRFSQYSYNETINLLNQSVQNFAPTTKSSLYKDDTSRYEMISAHLKALFNLQSLSNEQKYCLACLSLLPSYGISTEYFITLSTKCEMYQIEDLYRKGWVQYDFTMQSIQIHPLISDTIRHHFMPSCVELTPFIEKIIEEQKHSISGENDSHFDDLLAISCNILQYHNLYNDYSWATHILGLSDYALYNGYYALALHPLYSIYEKSTTYSETTPFFKANLCYTIANALLWTSKYDDARKYENEAIQLLEKSPNLNANSEELSLLQLCYIELCSIYIALKKPDEAEKYARHALNIGYKHYTFFTPSYIRQKLDYAMADYYLSLPDEEPAKYIEALTGLIRCHEFCERHYGKNSLPSILVMAKISECLLISGKSNTQALYYGIKAQESLDQCKTAHKTFMYRLELHNLKIIKEISGYDFGITLLEDLQLDKIDKNEFVLRCSQLLATSTFETVSKELCYYAMVTYRRLKSDPEYDYHVRINNNDSHDTDPDYLDSHFWNISYSSEAKKQ